MPWHIEEIAIAVLHEICKNASVGMLVHIKGSRIAFHFVAEANGSRSTAAQLSAVTNIFPGVVNCSAPIQEGFKTHFIVQSCIVLPSFKEVPIQINSFKVK